MQTSNRLPRIAALIAFTYAGICALVALLGPILALPLALIPLCAGIGIWRNRIWSAYGYATVLLAQLLLLPLDVLRPWNWIGRAPHIVETILGSLGFGVLFLFAGRSLASSGAPRGRAWPWIAVALLGTIPFLFIDPFKISSKSMENTLVPGDSILAQVFPLRAPARGQLILFRSPSDRGQILVKRVIAAPGDHLRIATNAVILNGNTIDEKYVTHEAGHIEFYPEYFPNEIELPGCAEGHEMLSRQVVNGEIVVPAGSYFVLGDNRENSLDSRCWGFVTSSDVIGKPLMIYDSIDRVADDTPGPNQDWMGHRRWARIFKIF